MFGGSADELWRFADQSLAFREMVSKIRPMEPQITTVIPTYRRPTLLRRAIQSVLAQTYPHFIVCVYDNASGDETAAVVGELARRDSRVRYYCHPENIGPWRNFAHGANQVTTPFFSLLSDDDVLLPNFFAEATRQLADNPQVGAFAGLSIRCDPAGRMFSTPNLEWKGGLYYPPGGCVEILTTGHFEWNAMLFRRDVLETLGGLDASISEPLDLDFQLRLAARFPLVVLTSPCALFIMHPNQASSQLPLERLVRGLLAILHKFETDPSLLRPGDRERILPLMRFRFRSTVRAAGLKAAAVGEAVGPSILDPFEGDRNGSRAFASMITTLNRRDLVGATCRLTLRIAERARFATRHGVSRLRFARMELIAKSALNTWLPPTENRSN